MTAGANTIDVAMSPLANLADGIFGRWLAVLKEYAAMEYEPGGHARQRANLHRTDYFLGSHRELKTFSWKYKTLGLLRGSQAVLNADWHPEH